MPLADVSAIIGPDQAQVSPELMIGIEPVLKQLPTTGIRAVAHARKWRRSMRTVKRVRRLMGWDQAEVYDYRLPLGSHPLLDLPGPHPDDVAAFAVLAGPALAHAARCRSLHEERGLATPLRENLVTIGSPEVDPVLRLALDYRRKDHKPGYEYRGTTVSPPYRWHEDPEAVEATCYRAVAGVGIVERPNWPLIHNGPDGESRLVPQTGRDGLLLNDWLVVTVMPNFLTQEALQGGKRLINVAGLHGVGTRAIELAFRDRDLLIGLEQRLGSRSQYFQAVFEAAELRHDPVRGARATRVRLHDVVPLEISWDRWEAASGTVGELYADWVLEQHPFNDPPEQNRR